MDLTAMTLNTYLDAWLVLARTPVTPTTYRSYVYRCRTYLRPKLGDCLVGGLTIPQLRSGGPGIAHLDETPARTTEAESGRDVTE